jgi:3-isopropylmalate/(R)-2-methylmalate dehydratase small subunit
MEAVRRVVGRALPLPRADVDTDQIIPSHWLKRLERTGYGPGLFEAWRRDPAFALNDPRYAGASILLAGPNFGCGSSREHAVWALHDSGFRAVVSPRLADIFKANALRNGLLTVELDDATMAFLFGAVRADPATEIAIDVDRRTLDAPGLHTRVAIDDYARTRLLEGVDDIDVTLRRDARIREYEAARPEWLPTTRGWPVKD